MESCAKSELETEMDDLGFGYDQQKAILSLINKSGYSYKQIVEDYSRAGAKLVYNKLSKKLNLELA